MSASQTGFSSNQSAFALNRKANQVAQSNPALAARLRMLAYQQQYKTEDCKPTGKKQPVKSVFSLNRNANRIAQSQPAMAAKLRFLAAYA